MSPNDWSALIGWFEFFFQLTSLSACAREIESGLSPADFRSTDVQRVLRTLNHYRRSTHPKPGAFVANLFFLFFDFTGRPLLLSCESGLFLTYVPTQQHRHASYETLPLLSHVSGQPYCLM